MIEDVFGLFLESDEDVLFEIEADLLDLSLLSHRISIDEFDDEKESILEHIEFRALLSRLNVEHHQWMDFKSLTETR